MQTSIKKPVCPFFIEKITIDELKYFLGGFHRQVIPYLLPFLLSYLLYLGREHTASSKQNVDAFNLQLQNLRYEVLHLRKEVSRCINFRSADEDIKLVPVEQFYQEADPDIAKPDTTQGKQARK